MLNTERAFYAARLNEWMPAYGGLSVAIKGEEIIGFFDARDDALAVGAARLGLDSFLVRCVGDGEQTVIIPALALGVLGGGRRYWLDVIGQRGWLARYLKDVDADETTLRFWQEIYDDQGKLIERHEKYPVDKGHQKV